MAVGGGLAVGLHAARVVGQDVDALVAGQQFAGEAAYVVSDPYPTACSPQAWAATTPIRLVTNLMRYDTHVSLGGVWVDPVLPESYGDLHISNAPLAGGRITIDISDSVPSVQGLPEGIKLRRGKRPYLTELVEQAGLYRKA